MVSSLNIDGKSCYRIASELYPVFRSITGQGVRDTLDILKKYAPMLNTYSVKSGTAVFDWTVPPEWNCYECYIEDADGNRLIDFRNSGLHVLGYSCPIDKWMKFSELKNYLYVQSNQPDVIPYVTSYYEKRTGFCLSVRQMEKLASYGEDYEFHAVIKSEFNPDGVLNYGEFVLEGESEKEILISTYICHPFMANNECSGPALSVVLANYLKTQKRKYTYRFVFIPETIGSITYISQKLDSLKKNVIAGFVLSCVGDDNSYALVRTRYGNTLADRVMENVLRFDAPNFRNCSFLERGSDERQYNAPGVDLPVCGFCRSKYGTFPEYHTSKDDLTYISEKGFDGALNVLKKAIAVIENNDYYRVNVLCEPQLGKRSLYPTISQKGVHGHVMAMRNFIAYADGKNDLMDISNLIGVPAFDLIEIKNKLLEHNLLSIHKKNK